MESHSPSNTFELTVNRDMESILSSLSALQTNNILTGIAVQVYLNSYGSITIRKSTIRRRYGTIKLSLSLKKTEKGVLVRGRSEIDWGSYWPIGLMAFVILFSLSSNIQAGIAILVLGGIMSAVFLSVAFFEKQNMIEEVKQLL